MAPEETQKGSCERAFKGRGQAGSDFDFANGQQKGWRPSCGRPQQLGAVGLCLGSAQTFRSQTRTPGWTGRGPPEPRPPEPWEGPLGHVGGEAAGLPVALRPLRRWPPGMAIAPCSKPIGPNLDTMCMGPGHGRAAERPPMVSRTPSPPPGETVTGRVGQCRGPWWGVLTESQWIVAFTH